MTKMTNQQLLETLEQIIPELEERGLIKSTYVKMVSAILSSLTKMVRNEKFNLKDI